MYSVHTQHVESTKVFVIFWVNWKKNSWSDKEISVCMQEIVCIYDKVPKYVCSTIFFRVYKNRNSKCTSKLSSGS